MKNSSRLFFYLALLSFLVACGLHFYLTNEFYDVRLGVSGSKSVCNINQTFNCDAVAASNYSHLFEIPMALLGFLTNFVALLIFLIGELQWTENPPLAKRTALALSTFIALTSVVMGTISLTLVGHVCLFCVGAYATSLISFFSVSRLTPLSELRHLKSDIVDWFTKAKWIGILLILIPVGGFLGHRAFLDAKGFKAIANLINVGLNDWTSGPVRTFNPETGLKKKASGQALVTVVEFADFGCPHCRFAAPSLHAFKEAHPDVELVFKSYPLDGQCNGDMPKGGDGVRCDIAYMVFCSEQLAQKGWELYDWVFENQEDLFVSAGNQREKVHNQAVAFGVPSEELKKCSEGDAVRDSVRAMAAEGTAAGVQGTPSIYVNNKQLPYGQTLPVLQGVYDHIKNQR